MDVTDGDANLVRAFELVSQCCLEVNGLIDTLDELFEEELAQLSPKLLFKRDGKTVAKTASDTSGWLRLSYATSFPLAKKRTSVPSMYMGYQISMQGEGIIPEEKAPLIHVFLWSVPADFNDCYVNFPWDLASDLSLDSSRLLVWRERSPLNWDDREWTFSIKLTAMNHRQNLLESVVTPAMALLQMKSAMEALPDELPGLVFYPDSVISPVTE